MASDLRRIVSVPQFDELQQRREYIEPVVSVASSADMSYSQQLGDQVESVVSVLESFLLDWADYLSRYLPVDALVDYVVAEDLSSISRWESLASRFLEQWDQERYEVGVAYIGAAGLLRDMTEVFSFLTDGVVGKASSFRPDVKQALRRMDGSVAGVYRQAAVDVGKAIENSWLGMDVSPLESSVATLVSNVTQQVGDIWVEMTQHLLLLDTASSNITIDEKTRFLLISWIRSVTRLRLQRVMAVLRTLVRIIEAMIVMRTFRIRRVRVDWDTLVKDYLVEPLERQLRTQIVRFVTSKIIPVVYRLLDVADDLESIAEIIPGDEPDRSIQQFIVTARGYIGQAKYYIRYMDTEQSRRNVLAVEYSKMGGDITKLRAARDAIRVLIQFLKENAYYAQYEKPER